MDTWIIYAILSALSASAVAIFGKIGISGVDSTLATTIRALIMGGFMMIVSFSLGKFKEVASINNKALLFIALSGIAGAVSWIFYFIALKKGPASGVAALDRLSVVFVLVLAILFLNEHLTWKTGLGALLITAGAILMSWR